MALLNHVTVVGTGASSPIDTSGAKFIIALCTGVTPVGTPHDSLSQLWVSGTERTGAFGGGARLFWIVNPTGNATHTFSNPSTTTGVLSVLAFDSIDISSPFDAENGTNASAYTGQPGSVTPVAPGELFICGAGGGISTSFAINSGFSIPESAASVGGVNYSGAIAYKIQSGGAAAENPLWTTSNSDEALVMAVFKPGAGGGTIARPHPFVIVTSRRRRRTVRRGY